MVTNETQGFIVVQAAVTRKTLVQSVLLLFSYSYARLEGLLLLAT